MRTLISVASVLACAFSLDAQITVTVNREPGGLPYLRIRNNSAVSLAAFAVSMNYVDRSAANYAPLMVYVDPAIDTTAKPLPPNQEHTVQVFLRSRPGQPIDHLFEEPITAGIFADGSTTGDAALLTRLMWRRSNMLLAVETALETLSDAGRSNIPRDQLIKQFKRMADSLRRWYLSPEQQIGLQVYQPIIGKLMNLPEGEPGSPFPPSTFVAAETAVLVQQRAALSESQPSLADAASIGR